MKCSECSHDIVEKTAKFCSNCGTKLSVQPTNTQGKLINSETWFNIVLLTNEVCTVYKMFIIKSSRISLEDI